MHNASVTGRVSATLTLSSQASSNPALGLNSPRQFKDLNCSIELIMPENCIQFSSTFIISHTCLYTNGPVDKSHVVTLPEFLRDGC